MTVSDNYRNYSITQGKSYEGDEDVTRINITVQVDGSDSVSLEQAISVLDSIVQVIKDGH